MAVVAVEETALLPSVKRVVGGVHAGDDLTGRLRVGLDERIRKQPVDRVGIGGDPSVAVGRRPGHARPEPVQRAGTGQRMAPAAPPDPVGARDIAAAHRQRQDAAVARPAVVVHVPVARRGPHHPPGDGAPQAVPHHAPVPVAGEAPGQPLGHAGQPPAAARRRRRWTADRRQNPPSRHAVRGG